MRHELSKPLMPLLIAIEPSAVRLAGSSGGLPVGHPIKPASLQPAVSGITGVIIGNSRILRTASTGLA